MRSTIHIGTQGWNYDGWIGSFYPAGTSKKEMLTLYAKVFDTVEIDSTFYAIPSENSVRGWYDRTPPSFTFSVKLPSEITHRNRLRDSNEYLLLFVERVLLLKEKLGCVLIQLPPDFSPSERAALRSFLKLVPREIKFSIEFRDAGWLSEETLSMLNEHSIALTLVDSKWINRKLSRDLAESPSAPFSYVRWLGPRELTDFGRVQIDRTVELNQWRETFQVLSQKAQTVFGYFNNHFQGHSPASCNEFKRMLGLPVVSPDELIIQPTLF